MQEIMKDGSEGKAFVEDTIEDLIPHIKKSLEDPNVKYVKIFRAKTISCITEKEEKKFTAEEEKKDTIDSFSEFLKEEKEEAGVVDEHLFKRKKEAKKSSLLYPITVLESERDNCGHLSGSLVAQLNKAIEILNDEIRKDELKKKEAIPYVKKL